MNSEDRSTPDWPAALDAQLVQKLHRPRLQAGVIDSRWHKNLLGRTRFMAERLPLLADSARPWGRTGGSGSPGTPIVYAKPRPQVAGDAGTATVSIPRASSAQAGLVQRAALPGHAGASKLSMPHAPLPTPPSSSTAFRNDTPRSERAALTIKPSAITQQTSSAASPLVKPPVSLKQPAASHTPVDIPPGTGSLPVVQAKRTPGQRLPADAGPARLLRELPGKPRIPVITPLQTAGSTTVSTSHSKPATVSTPVSPTRATHPVVQRAVQRPVVAAAKTPTVAASAPLSLPLPMAPASAGVGKPGTSSPGIGPPPRSGAVIQRMAAVANTGAQADSQPPQLPTMTATGPGPQVDVLQLSDQVYHRLLRRLASERERKGY